MNDKLYLGILVLVMISLFLDISNRNLYKENFETNENETNENETNDTNETDGTNLNKSDEQVVNKLLDKIQPLISTRIQNFIKNDYKKEVLDISKQKGPKGDKGDPGGKSVIYQGIYPLNGDHYPITIPKSDINFSASNSNNSNKVTLRNKSDNDKYQSLLTDNERWQFTTDGRLVNSKYTDYPICVNYETSDSNKNVFLCSKPEYIAKFEYRDNKFKYVTEKDGNKYLIIDNENVSIGDCDENNDNCLWSIR